jgi:opacity protein-like surface antigen
MKKFLLMGFVSAMCWLGVAQAADVGAPRFEDFAVTDTFVGKAAKVRLVSADDKEYATRIREASRQKPNFAGHYVLASWGCGASCVSNVAIDAKTGRVTWLPFTVCCWDVDVQEPIEFRRDSRLLVVHGSRNEAGNGTFYYVLEKEDFKLVKAVEKAAKN